MQRQFVDSCFSRFRRVKMISGVNAFCVMAGFQTRMKQMRDYRCYPSEQTVGIKDAKAGKRTKRNEIHSHATAAQLLNDTVVPSVETL